ncbi:MAG TPA: class I SAM-dependent methyltransferase [Gaiellaceae bacterium]|nr:class I SAM-dependent methyltransferase [Gaiellaceae bacterium]
MLPTLRDPALRLLDRARLLRPAYRAYEAVRARTTSRSREQAPDGLPLPPPPLRTLVAGTADAEWFLETGRRSAELVAAAAARHGVRLDAPGTRLLDFGCGCGRVTRHWARLAGADVHGSDYNARLVRWCAEHLPFARFARNGGDPPLPYPDGRFDLVYAISVFTHLTEPRQDAWLTELRRVLRPGGLLLVTTHGDRHADALAPDERARYDGGELVVRWESVAGTNLCAAFHPAAYVRERLARGLELLEHAAEGAAAGSPHQDLVVLRRPG